jgi:hypothetical protein
VGGCVEEGSVLTNVRVVPKAYATRTKLRLPLDGRLLVWDGHDFYGRRYRGDGAKNEDHFSYGSPVLAPGDGTVVAVASKAIEDGGGFSIASVRENGMVIFGTMS